MGRGSAWWLGVVRERPLAGIRTRRLHGRGEETGRRTFLRAAALALVSIPLVIQPASGAFPGGNGKIAFVHRDSRFNDNIAVINADGTGETKLTIAGGTADPSFSADGAKIVFRAGATINVMNADGSAVTSTGVSGLDPSFSPDGSKIVYWTGSQIAVMNANGTSPSNLTTSGYGGDPVFSPDGAKIAYADSTGIWRINADGTGKVGLFTPSGRTAVSPNWSPDGSRIVFASDRDSGFAEITEIYVMNADGSSVQRLTQQNRSGFLAHTSPAFSPDGTKVVFSRGAGGLVVMNADGTNQTTLATTAVHTAGTDWQPVASADLSLTMIDSPDPVTEGENLTYTLTASNAGPSAAAAVSLTDTLPSGVSFVSASASQGSCAGTSTVTCSLGTLANGASATVTVVVKATAAGTITNSASVSSSTADPSAGNSSASASTTVNAAPAPTSTADLSLTKTDSPDPVTEGENLTYTLTASNAGPSAAAAVMVSDTLPSGVSFVSASASQGGCAGTSTVTCSLGTLANGASATVTVVVKATAAGTITNSASVSSTTADAQAGNNSVSTTTTVSGTPPPPSEPPPPSADLALTMTATPVLAALQGHVTFEIGVVNNGPSTATGVVLLDRIPANVDVVGASHHSSSGAGGTCSDNSAEVRCFVGVIESGSNATASITFRTRAVGTVVNSATVAADEADAVLENNAATTAVSVRRFSRVERVYGPTGYPDQSVIRYSAIDGEQNDVSLEIAGNHVVITDNAAELRIAQPPAGSPSQCELLSPHQARCGSSGSPSVVVETGDRNDSLNVTRSSGWSGGPIVLDGGDGNDLIGGGPDPESLRGGLGADVLDGRGGDDSVFGGSGNDILLGGVGDDALTPGSNSDLVSGGAGEDVARYDDRIERVIVDIDNVADDGEAGERDNVRQDVEGVVGGSDDDFLTSSSTGAMLEGRAGNDRIVGVGGADSLLGGPGTDRIEAGGGADRLEGGAGDDTLEGGPGSDRIEGTSGSDRLYGGPGVDLLFGDGEHAPRDDRGETDRLYGEDGNDKLVGGGTFLSTSDVQHRNILRGGAGNDELIGSVPPGHLSYNDLEGGPGNDLLTAGGETGTELSGGSGNDVLYARGGVIDGDGGTDRLDLKVTCGASSSSGTIPVPIEVDLGAGHTGSGYARCTSSSGYVFGYEAKLKDIENIRGTANADILRGTIGVNIIEGNGGDDVIVGRHGDDRLFGGEGADSVNGDRGGDEIVGGAGSDRVVAGPGPDLIEARDGTADTIDCGDGEDRVFNDAADSLTGCEVRSLSSLGLLLVDRR